MNNLQKYPLNIKVCLNYRGYPIWHVHILSILLLSIVNKIYGIKKVNKIYEIKSWFIGMQQFSLDLANLIPYLCRSMLKSASNKGVSLREEVDSIHEPLKLISGVSWFAEPPPSKLPANQIVSEPYATSDRLPNSVSRVVVRYLKITITSTLKSFFWKISTWS